MLLRVSGKSPQLPFSRLCSCLSWNFQDNIYRQLLFQQRITEQESRSEHKYNKPRALEAALQGCNRHRAVRKHAHRDSINMLILSTCSHFTFLHVSKLTFDNYHSKNHWCVLGGVISFTGHKPKNTVLQTWVLKPWNQLTHSSIMGFWLVARYKVCIQQKHKGATYHQHDQQLLLFGSYPWL